MSSAIRAGAAYVEILLRDKEFQKGLAGAKARLNTFAASAAAAGAKMLVAGLAIAGPLAMATKVFAGFSDEMQTVRAVTQATEQDFAALTEQAKELGRTTSFTAKQVGEGMTALGRAGFKAGEILASTQHAMNLSRATVTDLGEAADIAGNTLRGFSLGAEEMQRVVDVLTATANGSAQTLTDLGESMKYVAPIAYESGASLEDTANALALLANNAIKGSMAGTALARAYKQFANREVQSQLKGIGVEVADAAGNMRPLAAILTDLRKATAGMGSVERLSIFEDVFGRGSAAASVLSRETAKLTAGLGNFHGVAAKTAKMMDAELGGSFRNFMSAVEGVAIAIGESLAPALKDASAKLTAMAGAITAFVKDNRELAVTVAKVAVGLLAAGAAMIALSVAAKTAAFAVGGLQLAMKSLTVAGGAVPIVALIALFAALGAAAGATRNAVRELDHAMADQSRTNKQQEQVHRTLLDRLETLSKQQRLSAEESTEAREIIRELTAAYGDLGISVDAAAGQIKGLADGQQQANKAMVQSRLKDVEAEYAEALANVQTLTDDLQKEGEKLGTLWGASVAWVQGEKKVRGYLDAIEEEIAGGNKRLHGLAAERGRLMRELSTDHIEWLSRSALSISPFSSASDVYLPGVGKLTTDEEVNAIAGINDEIARIHAEQIQDGQRREEALLELETRQRIEAATKASESIVAIEELHQEKLAAIREKYLRDRQAAEEDIQHDVARLEIEATKEGLAQRKALLELERQRELAEAAKQGVDIADAINKKYDLLGIIAEQQEKKSPIQSVTGTFSGYAVGRGGVAEVAKKTLDEIRQMRKTAYETLLELRRNGGNVQLA